MSAMSLYNQILAYIEGENTPAPLDTHSPPEPLVKSDESHDEGNHGEGNHDEGNHGDESPPESLTESLDTHSPHDNSPKNEGNDGGKNNEPNDASESLPKDGGEDGLITGGKLLSETVDNLTGGGMGKKESVKTPPPVKKDVDPNLFEGGNVNGAVLVTARSEARNVDATVNENGVRGRYTEFLHRLRTPKLFSGGSMKHASEDVDKDASESFVTHDSDTTLDGGNIDILPVFPYLIRY